MLVFQADGSALTETELAEFAAGRQLAAAAMTRAAASLPDGAPEEITSYLSLCEFELVEPEGISAATRLGFHYSSRISPATYESADPARIDWRLTNDYTFFPGDDLLLFGGGYGQIIAGLAEGLTIRYDTPVRQISRAIDQVTLTLASGETIRASKVLVTVPLGVLKAGAIQFQPPLPADKQAAIGRIGYGSFEKLALRFDQCYWPVDKQQFLYFEADAAAGDEALFLGWVNLAAYNGEPVLVSLCSGHSRVQRWHSYDDDALCTAALTLLRRLLGPLPNPTNYVRTGWQDDPFSQGGYSFQQVGQRPTDRATLAQPIRHQLYFAGEAIHPYFFATVHGAYESGVWAARQMYQASLR